MFRISGNEIQFQHHLLQEFFAGRGIADPDTVHQLIQDEWWKRAIVFFFGERADSIALLATSAKLTQGLEPSRLLEAATTIGLALQACYLSPVAEKLDVWKWLVEALEVCQGPAIKAADIDGKYPLTSFFHYYLYVRDSVSLSHLRGNVAILSEWAKEKVFVEDSSSETHMYWLIIGLIEAGDIVCAEELLKKFRPTNVRLLTAVHLGCHLAKEIRPLPDNEKEAAKRVCSELAQKIAPYAKMIINEMGSLLLEMRMGKLTIIDEEEAPLVKLVR